VDCTAYRSRIAIEHLINRLKQLRRIATRYEKIAANYVAMVHIAAIRKWLKV
jgi:transposase